MKPIEPGCKAMIVKSAVPANLGKVVTVVRYLGKVPGFNLSDRWQVAERIIRSKRGLIVDHTNESKLIRIDGFDPVDIESDERRVTA